MPENAPQSPLISKLIGEIPPRPPKWSDRVSIEQYCRELESHNRQMLDYIRRLLVKFSAANIAEELKSDPSTTYVTPTP